MQILTNRETLVDSDKAEEAAKLVQDITQSLLRKDEEVSGEKNAFHYTRMQVDNNVWFKDSKLVGEISI